MSVKMDEDTPVIEEIVVKNKKKRPKFIRIVPCKVCGSDANDHLHYGSIVCYSCRAFFRRIVANAKEPNYCQFNYGQSREMEFKKGKKTSIDVKSG